MARQPNAQIERSNQLEKRDLQRQIARTRGSLAETVGEIKETAEQGYESVKQGVSDVLDYREQFQKEPVVWSLGALSAGFALGYTLGHAHKISRKGRQSQLAEFGDRIVDDLSKVGQDLVIPTLNTKIRELFGLDFADLLKEMRGSKSGRRRRAPVRARLKSGRKRPSRVRKRR
jgi:hypothetical protein